MAKRRLDTPEARAFWEQHDQEMERKRELAAIMVKAISGGSLQPETAQEIAAVIRNYNPLVAQLAERLTPNQRLKK